MSYTMYKALARYIYNISKNPSYKRKLHLPFSLQLSYELPLKNTSDFGINSWINTFNNGISRSDLAENYKGPSHTH